MTTNNNAKPSRRGPLPKGRSGPVKTTKPTKPVPAAAEPAPQAPEPQVPEPQAPAPQAPEPQVPEPQAPAFDLDSFLAGADTVISRIELNRKAGERLTRAAAAARQRVSWPQQVEQAAAAAGIRLPGLYPKPGSRSARGANGNGWFRELPKSGKPGQPERNDLARSILWELACRDLATTEEGIPTAQLLAAAAVIRRTYQRDKAQAPEWSLYLVAPAEKRPDGTVIGQGTCLLHQAALMAGEAVILTPERIRRV